MTIIIKNKENLKVMLSKFKKEVFNSGLVQEIKERRYYLKPSEKRNRENNKRKLIKKKRKIQQKQEATERKKMKRMGRRY